MSRVRPVGGRPTPMGCGRRWPPMTRCCAGRSRRTAAGCSSTPVTGCVPRSRRRGRRWMRRWPRSGRWSCRCGWGSATGEAELRGADYFGAVLNRAARVMAAGHGGQILLAESTAGLLSGVDLLDLGPRRLRDLPTPIGVFQVRAAGPAHGVPGVAGAGCESGEPAACGHQLHRARVRGRRAASRGEGSSAGDVDRGGRGRQDPPGAGGRGAAGR